MSQFDLSAGKPVVQLAERQLERPCKPLRWFHIALLLAPFVGLLWPPFYARSTPEIFGIPFFYTYQFAWVFVSAALTGLVYRSIRGKR